MVDCDDDGDDGGQNTELGMKIKVNHLVKEEKKREKGVNDGGR